MFRIIAVTSRKLCDKDFLGQIEKIAQAQVSAIILREKDLSQVEYKKLAGKVLSVCASYSIECILHYYPEVARGYGQSSIHLPLPLLHSKSEELEGFNMIGTSVHSLEEAVEAESLGATYLTAGHIYKTDCKKGVEPRGISFLEDVVNAVSIPVYAIGGISELNIEEIRKTGASGACIMSEFMQTECPKKLSMRLVNSTIVSFNTKKHTQ